jgi:acetoin utilization deacetylase AcuC-like enzyme
MTAKPKPVPVFFTPLMVADSRCASPSAAKPAKVVESWKAKFPIEILEPTPVTALELSAVHDPKFVADILAGTLENGFGNMSPQIAASLPYTSGAMLSAARYVLEHGGAAAAPCSGFHHAEWAKCMGYCTFNGLMVTALALMEEGHSVAILDCDEHYGNGTDDIIEHLKIVESNVYHFTAGQDWKYPWQASDFLGVILPEQLAKVEKGVYDVVLYQAGADPHIDDPQGGWLTTEQLRLRDALVFDTLHAMKIPVVWNLAGGYQIEPDGSIPKVLEIHDNTMRECVRVYGT